MFEPGTIIGGHYRLEKLLGEGGMGAVYEGLNLTIYKKVAIKFLSQDFIKDKEALKRFHQEAWIAARLGHLNICDVLDFGVTPEGIPYIIMEYLEGFNLGEVIKLEKRLDEKRALQIMSQVLDALAEAHSRGIVHRDLKPENIFLAQIKGLGEVVKILDFGISKVMKSNPDTMKLTKTGVLVGTPYYMSPEQVRGQKGIDARCDIWACGVILYEMLTGQVPFGGETYNEIIIKVIEQEFPDPRKINPSISDEVASVILQSTQKDITKRTPSAIAMKNEINAILNLKKGGIKEEIKEKKVEKIKVGEKIGTRRETSSTISSNYKYAKRRVITIAVSISAVIFILTAGIIFFVSGRKNRAEFSLEAGGGIISKTVKSAIENSMAIKGNKESVVKITFEGIPFGSKIRYDDKVVDGKVVELERSGQTKRFIISADGYEPEEIQIIPDRNRTIAYELKKIKSGEKEVLKKEEVKKEKKEKKGKSKIAEGAGSEKKEGGKGSQSPSPKWDYPGG